MYVTFDLLLSRYKPWTDRTAHCMTHSPHFFSQVLKLFAIVVWLLSTWWPLVGTATTITSLVVFGSISLVQPNGSKTLSERFTGTGILMIKGCSRRGGW